MAGVGDHGAYRLEGGREGLVGLEAILGPLRQAAQHDLAQALGHVGPAQVRRTWRFVGDRHQERHQVRAGEGALAGQQLVERRAQAVDVGAHVEGAAAQLLR